VFEPKLAVLAGSESGCFQGKEKVFIVVFCWLMDNQWTIDIKKDLQQSLQVFIYMELVMGLEPATG
jgi:hypothetical protein